MSDSRAIGSRVSIADWQIHHGKVLLDLGKLAEARSCFNESLDLYLDMNNARGQADALISLAEIGFQAGLTEEVLHLLREGFQLYGKILEDMAQTPLV